MTNRFMSMFKWDAYPAMYLRRRVLTCRIVAGRLGRQRPDWWE